MKIATTAAGHHCHLPCRMIAGKIDVVLTTDDASGRGRPLPVDVNVCKREDVVVVVVVKCPQRTSSLVIFVRLWEWSHPSFQAVKVIRSQAIPLAVVAGLVRWLPLPPASLPGVSRLTKTDPQFRHRWRRRGKGSACYVLVFFLPRFASRYAHSRSMSGACQRGAGVRLVWKARRQSFSAAFGSNNQSIERDRATSRFGPIRFLWCVMPSLSMSLMTQKESIIIAPNYICSIGWSLCRFWKRPGNNVHLQFSSLTS